MIGLTLDTKKCMAELLLRTTFDDFTFIEGEITTFNRFKIDGVVHKDFYGDMNEDANSDSPANMSENTSHTSTTNVITYSTWKCVKEYCLSIIKGKRTPLDFRFIFALSDTLVRTLITEKALDFQPEIVQGLYLNFRYDGSTLACITGTALKTFTLDKTLEHAFDQWIREFFTQNEIKWDMQG